MLDVVCMKWGDWPFPAQYVNRLYRNVEKYMSVPHRFTCIADEWDGFDSGVNVIPFEPFGTWNMNKMFVYKEGLFEGRVLTLDLDVEIIGSLDEIASYDGPFATVRDWNDGEAGGCVNAFPAGTLTHLHAIARECDVGMFGGSERLFYRAFIAQPDYWQDMYPGQFVSYKVTPEITDKARIICFHGRPRPHEAIWSGKIEEPAAGRDDQREHRERA